MKTIIPLQDRVVIQAVEQEKTTSSGFIVHTKEKDDRPQSGKVISVGPTVKEIEVGDEVIFKEFIPTTFSHEKEKYLIVNEEDILAKIA